MEPGDGVDIVPHRGGFTVLLPRRRPALLVAALACFAAAALLLAAARFKPPSEPWATGAALIGLLGSTFVIASLIRRRVHFATSPRDMGTPLHAVDLTGITSVHCRRDGASHAVVLVLPDSSEEKLSGWGEREARVLEAAILQACPELRAAPRAGDASGEQRRLLESQRRNRRWTATAVAVWVVGGVLMASLTSWPVTLLALAAGGALLAPGLRTIRPSRTATLAAPAERAEGPTKKGPLGRP